MRISRIVIRNFRSLQTLDIRVSQNTTCVIGENNTGKTNLPHALRICLDVNLPSSYRALSLRCLIPDFDGALFSLGWKDAL
nr:AAA family ATPase [Rhodomicrobium vannielii]